MSLCSIFIAVAVLCGAVAAANGNNDIAAGIMEKVGQVDIEALNRTAMQQLDKNLKTKCEQNGHPESYDKILVAWNDNIDCVKNLVNVTELQSEIEKARPSGDLDIVFGKHCQKRTILTQCMSNFTSVLESCLTSQEINTTRIIQNVTDSLLNFICYKEGDRIALFIAAGGPECIQSKQGPLQDCLNATYGGYIPSATVAPNGSAPLPSLESLPPLILGLKQCSDMAQLQKCVVDELEKCSDPTPGNIADALFTFVKRVTPCESLLSAQTAEKLVHKTANRGTSNTNIITLQSIVILTAAVMKIL